MSKVKSILKPEIVVNQNTTKIDYWWYKENYRQLTAELPASRVNSARKIISNQQIYQLKMYGSRTIRANITNSKKKMDNTTEITIDLWNNETLQKLSPVWEECHQEVISLINGELTHLLYEECKIKSDELFLLPKTIHWQCDCQASKENSEHFCDHVLAVLLKILDECKYMPILYFQFRGFGLSDFKQLFFDLPQDDSGLAELPLFLENDFYTAKLEKIQLTSNWLEDYYGQSAHYSETLSHEIEPFREQRYYYHKYNHDFYETLDYIKKEMFKFWQNQE